MLDYTFYEMLGDIGGGERGRAWVRCKYNMPIYTFKSGMKKTQFFLVFFLFWEKFYFLTSNFASSWFDDVTMIWFYFHFERWNFVDNVWLCNGCDKCYLHYRKIYWWIWKMNFRDWLINVKQKSSNIWRQFELIRWCVKIFPLSC